MTIASRLTPHPALNLLGAVIANNLQRNEWDFDAVPPRHSRSVLFYEYSRQSLVIRRLVFELRQMDNPAMMGDFQAFPYLPLSVTRRNHLRKGIASTPAFERLVEALMNCSDYPNTPASELKDQNWVQQLGRIEPVKFCEGEITDPNPKNKALDQILHKPGIEYRFKGTLKTAEFQSVFVLMVDWRKPNAEITTAFRNKVFTFRPDRFRRHEKIPPEQAAFGDLCETLPFKPLTALVWLGELRRFEAVNHSWPDYFNLYGPKTLKGYDSWKRKRLRNFQRARQLVAWLESGGTRTLTRDQFR